MKNIYIVIKFGGEYEDKWESIDSAYLTKESAEKRVEEIESGLNNCVSEEEWDRLCQEVEDYENAMEDNIFDSTLEGIFFLHKDWESDSEMRKKLEATEDKYENFMRTYGAFVEEKPLYEK